MKARKKFFMLGKKTLATVLAMTTVAVGAFSGMTFAQKETEVTVQASSSILSNEDRGVIYANSRTDFRDETIYFVITTRFFDGDSSNNTKTSEDTKAQNPDSDPSWRGDFAGLIEKLDYIKALGFTAIWITPVVENDSGYDYHGYHAYNFSAVDTRYESNGITYQDLINAVHEKGMKIIQDVVLNHTCNWGEENLLQITSDVYSTRNQVVMNGTGDPDNIYHHNGFCGGGDWDNYEAQRKTIADDCFDLETENPTVYNYLVDCYTDYIEMGVDGFRIDTVKHISRLTFNTVFLPAFKKAGGDDFYMFGEVCTKGHDVWYRGAPPISTCFYTWADSSTWTSKWSTDTASNEALVEAHYNANMDCGSQPTSDNAFLKGNEYHTPDYSQKSGMDVIDFQMHWSFNDANSAFNTAKGEDQYFNDSTWNVVYVDSHDYAPDQCQTQRYTGGTTKWAENLSLMFTFRGIPCLYYGSEIEFQAGKPIDVGPNSPLSQTGRAYFGDHIEGTVEATGFTVFDNLSGEVENTLDSTLSQHIMRLNRIRQAIPALRKGQYSTDGCNGNIAFKRRYTDATTDSFALVAISGGATFSGIPNGKYVDAVTGDVQNVTNGTLTASVSGQANMKVYVLDTAKTPAPGRVIPNGDYLTDGGSATLIKNERVDDNTVKPTSITVSPTSVSVLEGNTTTVTATVLPTDASNKKVTWTSSNDSVATVSGGTITGVSVGTATITAKTSNGLTATVSVTVKENPNIVKPTGVTVSPTTLTLTEGDASKVTATVAPSNATNKTVTWTSADTSVATVDSTGLVTAVGEGSTTITAKTSNGLTATVSVTVEGKTFTTLENGVYFEKPSSWGSDVYVYMWKKSNSEKLTGEWPGTKIQNLEDNIYGFSCNVDTSDAMIIFNAGLNQPQTDDLTFEGLGLYDTSGWVKEITEKGKVSIQYVDEDGNVLSTKSMSGDVGASYSTVAITIDGYKLKTTPSNANGTYTAGTTTVTYVYEKEIIDDILNGWNEINGKWYYYEAGVMQTSKWIDNRYYVKADGSRAESEFVSNGNYYIGSDGVWVTGSKWLQVSGKYYYLKSGTVQKSKWVKVGTKYYYFDASGVMQSSKWIGNYYVKADGSMAVSEFVGSYYVDANGAWVTGTKWVQSNNNYYYLVSGVAQKNKWVKVGTKYYYFNASGVMQANKWISNKYYVKADGSMAANEFVGNYYVDASGAWVTGTKWVQTDGKYYYLVKGVAQKAKWVKVGSYYFYFDASGVMQANKWISNKYYVKSNGAMAANEFVCDGKYYVDANGVWVTTTGWKKVGDKWYYLVKGVVQMNKWINNVYYVKADGSMAVNEWIGGKYYFDSDGKWVQDK
ncbi:MAG: Ig-like domain-containing protein [Lachnospiraceae bacterium]|nr:Ig-like domain-containing protein [Lachnospiraceae bacterium]